VPAEVYEKWGFGLAPPKERTQRERLNSAAAVQNILNNDFALPDQNGLLDHLSVVKGLFNRIARQDQWDWFTVKGQLGYPSGGISKVIASRLIELRSALRDEEVNAGIAAWIALRHLPSRKCLDVFLGRLQIPDETNAGWVYILSTREIPDLLKIGMTTRTVEERVREINRATGVVIPFGVRACWRVKMPSTAERMLHQEFNGQRIRSDREFFRIDFFQAQSRISVALTLADLEIRTLNNLSTLADSANSE
jgi:T5orf172 domain